MIYYTTLTAQTESHAKPSIQIWPTGRIRVQSTDKGVTYDYQHVIEARGCDGSYSRQFVFKTAKEVA